MIPFNYCSSELLCEGLPLSCVAERFGTPVYVYSQNRILENFNRFERDLTGIPHLTCYSVKANSTLRILKLLVDAGAGFDVVSGGELARVRKVGASPERVVFSGVGKTAYEIDAALRWGILMFNVESEGELEVIEDRARRLSERANISIRVNPDVETETHPYVSTGQQVHKFGVPKQAAPALYHRAASSPHLNIRGIACHIGSQILDIQPFLKALDEVLGLVRQLGADGIQVKCLDLGGGFGIRYATEEPLDFARLSNEIAVRMNEAGPAATDSAEIKSARTTVPLQLILEPGRSILGDAGALLTRILYVKRGPKNFIVVDAGMNDLMRPALYGSYHEVVPVHVPEGNGSGARLIADVVGPLCETGDFLARDRELTDVRPGDLLGVLTTGAYGYVLTSNYNSRPRPAEVLVDGSHAELIRSRETVEDLMAREAV